MAVEHGKNEGGLAGLRLDLSSWRLEQEDREFEACLGYMAGHCLKTTANAKAKPRIIGLWWAS